MIVRVAKGTRLNLRISDAFRKDIETLADYHGLTLSSYAHSILIRHIRREKQELPELFGNKQTFKRTLPATKIKISREDDLKKRRTG